MKHLRGQGGVGAGLALGVLCAILLAVGERGAAANAPFGFDDVVNQAKSLAGQPFKPPATVPEVLTKMAYDQYRDIRFRRSETI